MKSLGTTHYLCGILVSLAMPTLFADDQEPIPTPTKRIHVTGIT